MPITIVSDNLNVFGNNGHFESDPSTWGFDASPTGILNRDATHKYEGTFAQRNKLVLDFGLGVIDISKAKAPSLIAGRKYLLRARVYVDDAAPIAPDACEFSFENIIIPLLDSETRKTVADARGAWVEVEGRFTSNLLAGPSTIFTLKIFQVDEANHITINNYVWVDKVEIYEFTESDEEPPPPEVIDKVWWSRNPITHQASAEVGWDGLTNVRIYNDVQVDENTDGVFASKLKVDLPPDEDGNVVFYNRQAFTNSLKAIPPTLNDDAISRLTDRIKKFKNNTAQLQDLEVDPPGETTASNTQLVLLGGLSKYAWASIDFFTDYLPTNKKFLTWAPLVKPVDKQQEDYLNFFVYADTITTLQLKIKAYFDDGTNESEVVTSLDGVGYRQLYQVPAGPSNTGAALINPAKNLLKYDLSLLDQDDSLISEVRTYILDTATHPRKRLFMFLNSLGSYEVLRLTGVAEKSVTISKSEIAKFLPYNYGALDGEIEMNDVAVREGGSYSSGLKDMTAAWLDYMKDLLLSRRVFDVTDWRRIPIVIQPGTFPVGADQNFEYFMRFTALEAYEDENYTPKNI